MAHPLRARRRFTALTAGGLLAAASGGLQAQDNWPSRPITIVVPQAAGGANDTVARAFAQKLSVALGQSVVVENRPGAGGNVGTGQVARAAKDGYTLMLTAQSAQTINPALYRNPGFDPVKDFEPVMVVATAPYLLVVNPNFPAKTFRELIDYAKARPGRVDYSSAGNGTLNHLLGVMLNQRAGLYLVHIPYRGAAASATDVVGGQVPLTFGSFPGVMPFVKTGQLRVLGVATEKRTRLAPDMPTLNETVPGLHANSWYGLFAPAGTPKEVIRKLAAEGAKVLAAPDLQERLAGQGAEAAPSTPEQLAELLKQDLVRWAGIVKASGATID
ncbi:MAG TPA: tripartite tricarboxylate transporter substrate binding protein [Burkholderiaceae bacterium]|nr:tripartite tricarboxylate transporter substrate binding protein [Burkholderiaceae bacterium]